MAEAEEKLKNLHYDRGNLKRKLTLFFKFMKTINVDNPNDVEIQNLQQRLNKIESIFDDFERIQDELEKLDKSESNFEERDSFQNDYFEIISKATTIISKFNNKHEVLSEMNNQDGSVYSVKSQPYHRKTNIRLPQIDLPSFDGTFTLWRQFYDIFTAMIHDNIDLSNCQKLCYLRASVKGEPANMLRSLETTETNYIIAWESLCERYNHKRRIINNHIQIILNLEAVVKESHVRLRQFIDTLQMQIECLRALGQPIDQWDAFVVAIALNKLDLKTVQEWESYLNSNYTNDQIPSYEEFTKFLNKRQSTLEAINIRFASSNNFKPEIKPKFIKAYAATTNINCIICNGNHFLQNCESFLKLNPTERFVKIKQLKLCTNCLRKGHFVTTCQSTSCRICHKKHHTVLHLDTTTSTKQSIDQPTPNLKEPQLNDQKVVSHCSTLIGTTQPVEVLLATAEVNASNKDGKTITLKAVLDSASQFNFISERACNLLNLSLTPSNMCLSGITQSSTTVRYVTNLKIASKHNMFETIVNCGVLPKVTGLLPTIPLDINQFNIPPNIKLADPHFNQPKEVDLLISSSIFWDLLCIGQLKQPNGIRFQKTKLGWIVTGEIPVLTPSSTMSFLSLNLLNNELQKFWKVDEFNTNRKFLTPEEEYCESYFQNTTTRTSDGKFMVRIPLKSNVYDLGNSYETAKSRLFSLERRFQKDPSLRNRYINCITDYQEQNHLEESEYEGNGSFYLPHHAVIKESRTTTKLRVVFDGSCRLVDGLSVNQLQYVGPTIQEDLFAIITRFRSHKHVITGDIAQMYRQIWVHPQDRKLQMILWRDSTDMPIKCYKLKTVTFGMTSAPWLAIRCLSQLANDNLNTFPIESNIIKTDFYVDDILTGADSIVQLKTIKQNLINLLKQGGFDLRKFKSNVSELNDFDTQTEDTPLMNCKNKALGVYWNPSTDKFTYNLTNQRNFDQITKRTILTNTAQLFDPIGLLAPIIVVAKLIIQEVWKLNLSWDETLPLELHTRWLKFKDELKNITRIIIPRYILIPESTIIEIHGFADASEKAYGACVYLKSINQNNQRMVKLLAAKSRVAPLKSMSLPRLELLAAVLLTQLMSKFESILKLKIDHRYYWSDSTIVLNWIQSHPSKWVTFVANRVSFIQELTVINNWYHVKSHENPADIISRGMLPTQLVDTSLWWNGPKWLAQQFNPLEFITSDISDISERTELKKKYTVMIIVNQDFLSILENHSNLNKIKRIIAWCIRFITNSSTKSVEQRNYSNLNNKELDIAFMKLIKLVQIQTFPKEYQDLLEKRPIHKKSSLLSLSPFLDEHDLIRVGGRLKESDLPFNKRHPILLPKQNKLTKLIFVEQHQKLLHAGPTLLLGTIREKFWPISGRNIAKNIVRNCVKCFRFNPITNSPIMGNLPSSRINPMPPFHTVGIDFAGPISIKDKQGRGNKLIKAYISLFVCFTTKAIHLELVTSLSSDAFLAAFRRFVARRGKPLHVYSDNGTNFQGANNELRNLYKCISADEEIIINDMSDQGITWHFIPPYSPHFGGLWEAGVKSTKYHLRRVLKETSLIFEELYTVLTQIEATLNSRPLTPMSSDPNDLQALTPAHFLIGRPYTSVADPDVQEIHINRLDRYQYLQRLNQQFWTRWSKEYISQMQQRVRWKQNTQNVKVGSMVLVKEDNMPPTNWRLGRIISLHQGNDNIVRVVTVKCEKSVIKRSVTKLCALPICEDD